MVDSDGDAPVDRNGAAQGETHLSGQAIYTRPVLAIYDLWVHGLSNPLVWKCPTPHLHRLYARHLSANHMDMGVGTGSLLDRATFPSPAPRLALVDANEACLAVAGRRLRRYRPERYRRNVLEPLGDVGPPFASIGLTYLLHCLARRPVRESRGLRPPDRLPGSGRTASSSAPRSWGAASPPPEARGG